eukprot:4546876-Pyramimonas_sp.AAC.1
MSTRRGGGCPAASGAGATPATARPAIRRSGWSNTLSADWTCSLSRHGPSTILHVFGTGTRAPSASDHRARAN